MQQQASPPEATESPAWPVESVGENRYISPQERATFQNRIARIAFIALVFLILFSVAAGGYWFLQNKNILQEANKAASITTASVITPVQIQHSQSTEFMVNPHALPLGDGKVSSSPKLGYVYSCRTNFSRGGAEHAGSWIDGNTWDLAEKLAVEGSVTWPNARFSVTVNGTTRVITGNGLPVDSTTGTFPISPNDSAFQIDRNPNSIQAQTISLSLPKDPVLGTPSCVPMGMVGIALNGVPIFNALDDAGRDAVAHEVQDSCSGHPQKDGMYHYHGPSPCIPGTEKRNTLIGYALDGFGIYSGIDDNGNEINNGDLDVCHGMTSAINWDGKEVVMYHYVMTQEYPYTIGCFRGTKVMRVGNQQGMRNGLSPVAQ